MAEFCKECLLEMMKVDLKKKKIIMSKEADLCENCGNVKFVVARIVYRNPIKRCINTCQRKLWLMKQMINRVFE